MTENTIPVWIQILVGFGGFTVCNVVAMSVLWGRMTKTIENHSERLGNIEDRLFPDDSSQRLMTSKDCIEKQGGILCGLTEIKTMIRELDNSHSERMTRIEGRRDEMLTLIYNVAKDGAAK